VNPWEPQPKYVADFDKIKCLEFTLLPGKTLYIPAYWWYSIKFNNNTSITSFNYRTYMNNLAISPYICLHALQIQNIKRDVVKKVSIQELNKNDDVMAPSDNTSHVINNTPQLDIAEDPINNASTNISDLPEAMVADENVGTNID
jgi:hypothetical protein